MTYDPQYLGRNLTGRVKDTVTKFQQEMLTILSQATLAGAGQGSRVYIMYQQKGLEVLRAGINDAVQFAFSLTSQHTGQVYEQVAFCAKRMVDEMMNALNQRAGRSPQYGDIVGKTRIALEDLRDKASGSNSLPQ